MRCSGKGFVWPGSGTRSFRRAGRGCAASCPPATPVRSSTSRSRRSGGWEPSSALSRHARLRFSFGFCGAVDWLAPQVLSRLHGLTLWQVWTFCDQLLFWGSLVGCSQPFLDLMAALSPLGRPWEVVAMRVLSMLGTVLACGATALSAQRSHRIELGGVGTYTRYDPLFGPERQFGGGRRARLFFSENNRVGGGGGPTRAGPTGRWPRHRPRLPRGRGGSVVVAGAQPPAPAVPPPPAPPPAFAPPPAPAPAPAPIPAVERRTPAAHFAGGGGHAGQFEFGAFGSYTRYDRAYNLKNQVGGGGRLALFISDKVSIEVEGGFQRPSQNVGTLSTQLVLGSVSLVLNAPSGRNLFYLLGGYTRFTFRDTLPPYDFTDNALHGAIGDRLFLTDHVALRVEGRAVWSPTTNLPGGKLGGQIIGTAGLSYFTAKGRLAQARAIGWPHQWVWGGQGRVLIYKTNRQPLTYDPIIGGHWLINGKRN